MYLEENIFLKNDFPKNIFKRKYFTSKQIEPKMHIPLLLMSKDHILRHLKQSLRLLGNLQVAKLGPYMLVGAP
jgi:hypothetical protein